ncbi:DUF4010 domain-containing protein [Bradyrhizobium japonicum]|uniref:DUF4010 domain-containing protein n=1 Tax=Bradyrhizobium japonicum TaxID=375 RepID=UPI0020117568|nr:DUF4010 domain-containing protein [Bradyrhizobium japonicum]
MIEQTSATAFVSDTFWQETTDDLYRHSAPAREGLSQIQADRRLAIFGRNRAPPSQSQSVLRKVAKRLWNSLTAMLLAGAVRGGLAVSGFASGVVSSTAAIGAMGARAREAPELLGAATAGATLSTVATIAQLAATNPSTLRSLMIPLLRAGAAATFCGAISTVKGMREIGAAELQLGRAFSLSSALLLALTLSGVLVSSAGLRETFGEIGLVISATVAGLADTHSPAAVAALAASGKINSTDAVAPILAALSTNALSKIVVGWVGR